MAPEAVTAGLLAHYAGVWPGRPWAAFRWAAGPIGRSLPRFVVVRFPPGGPREPWVYASLGAWAGAARGAPALEFCLLAPAEDPIHVETLAMLAHYHADPRSPAVGVGHALAIGRGWVDGSPLSHVLVSRPYPYGPALERYRGPGGPARVLWLLPIWPQEAQHATANGVEALEERLEAAGIDCRDPHRPVVV